MRSNTLRRLAVTSGSLLVLLGGTWCTLAQNNVLQPGDAAVASSSNSPGSEGVANAFDGTQAKYLNFDTRTPANTPSGFIVTPGVGATWVTGMAIQSANDAPERDPKTVTLEGSNDDVITNWTSGNWTLITGITNISSWETVFGTTNRYMWQTFSFSNFKPFKHYRWTVVEVQTPNGCCMQVAEVQLLGSALPPNVVQPGDAAIASSSNSPGSEGVANAIDGTQAKYLNFDTRTPANTPSGFVVTPSVGATVLNGISIESANDAPERDPKVVTIEGSNDETISSFSSGTWTTIATISNIPSWPSMFPGADRYKWQTFLFDNVVPFKHYRWTVVEVQTPNGCCMQVAEVQFLGSGAPKNVAQPGDAAIASSSNSPGSEGVANAIDGTQAKYLNFDTRTPANTPSGFVVTPSVGPTTITGLAMQSANDAPERDPKTVLVEGSNDDTISSFNSGTWTTITTISNIASWESVFGTTNRYQWQTFYFPNKSAFKHYRWTVLDVQTPNGCCMQIAEVQFLAITSSADCTKAQFLAQPVDTPVLSGSTATFFTTVNGPWPLQWFKDGAPIPGATKTSYTTEAITAANADAVYTVKIVGCEESQPVKATLFTPSATKSIGIHFLGGGANGAPTSMNAVDIAGIHQQAYWNNITNAADASTKTLVDSDNGSATIAFRYASTGAWGAGTGSDSPTQRLLNGIEGNNAEGEIGTFTFTNVPAGTYSVIVYSVSPPSQTQVNRYTIGNTSYYMRTMTSDEYKAAPGFYRSSSTVKTAPAVGDFVRFDNVQPVGDTITITNECLTTFDRETGINAIQLLINPPAAGTPPAITVQPVSTVAPTGGVVTLNVTATGNNLTYQWRKDGRNLPNGAGVSGATTSKLTIVPFNESHTGIYSVAVFNADGSVISANASVYVSKYNITDQLVGYWKFDETTGVVAANSAAGGKPANLVATTASWVAGQIANSVFVDVGTYLYVTNYTKATAQVSGAAWINIDSSALAADMAIFRNAQGAITYSGGNQRIVGQFELGLNYNTTNGNLRAVSTIGLGPNIAQVFSLDNIPSDSWHHLAFTADGAQLRLFVDGVEAASGDYLPHEINAPDIPWISIGQWLVQDTNVATLSLISDPVTPNMFVGKMDELALWTRALTKEEVTKLYQAGQNHQPLTTVVLTPPAVPPTLSAGSTNGNITLTWNRGSLLTAPAITGPWTTNSAATSPFTEAATGGAKFYRVVAP